MKEGAGLGHVWRGLYLLCTTHWLRVSSKALSLYAIYQGGNLSLLSSFTLPICHGETKWTSAKPINETFPELTLLICRLDMTMMTLYQLDYYFRAVEPSSDGSLINMGPQFCWGHRRIHHCTTVKVNLGLLLDVLIIGILQCRLTGESKHLSLNSPVFSISSTHL